MNLGLIGFGSVGKAFIKLLHEKKSSIGSITLKYIIKSNGGIYSEHGINIDEVLSFINNGTTIEQYHLWSDITIDTIIKNKDIDCLIELTSTNIENGEPGYTHIKKALQNNINVVTGNKGPILLNYKELKNIASKNNLDLKVGCTTGGALPSINIGTTSTLGSKVLQIEGILNGTTNFIIEEMENKKVTYTVALEEAQKLKIAESNPDLDVKGYDTAIKLLILTNIIMNTNISLKDIHIEGITNLSLDDILHAKQENKKIKLIGSAYLKNDNVIVEVKPKAINDTHPLYFVGGKNKGVSYKTDILGDMTIIGGASSPLNAAGSILRDILSL